MAIELYAFLYEKVKEIPGSPYRLVAQDFRCRIVNLCEHRRGVLQTFSKRISLLSQCCIGIRWGSVLSVLRML